MAVGLGLRDVGVDLDGQQVLGTLLRPVTTTFAPSASSSRAAAKAPASASRADQRPAANAQNSRISAGGVGPVIATWVSRTVTVPVGGITWAAVPVPPTQP